MKGALVRRGHRDRTLRQPLSRTPVPQALPSPPDEERSHRRHRGCVESMARGETIIVHRHRAYRAQRLET
jgi:hypothetical protein